ncbi:tryptophan synthase subunit alpha [Clostridium oryzae]|uniref:Tryptophan synthase alpha chain n=1 Tax=Clostridium oryzae TaxID=1450648 RepID=A0A1V4IXS9_9CLOT|nr:tryptophan synthase subunit alpha [Clostridium oryzae]OPJ64882.1 tryptophan synthase alpha chain [Clostridium oryzae]
MNRIDAAFSRLKEENRKALITFITAGDPDLDTSAEIIKTMENSGADIVEIGIPYSDPIADGPVIQNSSYKALKAGFKINNLMKKVKDIRGCINIPLVYMLYYNCIFKYGTEKFLEDCKSSGIDGIIIPDLPLEEREEFNKLCDKYDIYLIPLVAPTSNDRIEGIVNGAKGFVYCVSVAGVTGARSEIKTDIAEYMNQVAQYTSVPKALGFGISNAEMAEKYKPYCDGVIIGSAIVKLVDKYEDMNEMLKAVGEFVKEVKAVL